MKLFQTLTAFFLISCIPPESDPPPANWGEWCGVDNDGEAHSCDGGPFACLIDKVDTFDGGEADGVCLEKCNEDNDCGALILADVNAYYVIWQCIDNICTPTCDEYGRGCFEAYAGPMYCVNNLCTMRKPDGFTPSEN